MYKIYLVDNDETAVNEVKKTLSNITSDLTCFNQNYQDVLRRIFSEPPDLLLLDISFNDGDGINILKTVDSLKIPIIIITEINDTTAKWNCFKLGAAEYIIKPFDKTDLFYRVKNQLRHKQFSKSLIQYNSKLESVIEYKTKELYETHYSLIYTLASLVETRDNDAGDHLQNISYFSKKLAEELSFNSKYKYIITKEFIDNISLASALHDIGKITVRDTILLKPDRLSPEEFEFIKIHTINGGRMLEECKKTINSSYYLIDMAIEIATYHHEKWDGTGYNLGLKEEHIPISALIVALADVYDAMTSKRVYKSQMPHKDVVAFIGSQRCKHFAPDVVDAFFKLEEVFYAKKFGAQQN